MSFIFILLLPLLGAGLLLFIKKRLILIEAISLIVSFSELIFGISIAEKVLKHKVYSFTQYFSVDSLSVIILLLVALLGFITLCYSVGYFREELSEKVIGFTRVKQYYILTHAFLLMMFLAIIVTNPILMWIAIEGTTLSTAFLISFYNKPSSMEAAWKYLMVNSVGLLLGFFGSILLLSPLLQSETGLAFSNWQMMLSNITVFDPTLVKFAFIFIIIGFGTKMGLVPMHTWLPDAHGKAPSPTSSLLSGVLLNVAFLAILRYKMIVDQVVGSGFSQDLLIGFGIISIVFAAFIIFIQKNYKRLLAYSSIEHMGVVALGFGFGGIGVYAAILHMIYHSLTKSLLFLSSGNIILKYKSTKIHNVSGMISTLPVTGIIFFIGVLTITGVPPFGIFLTEFSILSAGITNHPIISIFALFSFTLVFIGFLRTVVSMYFGERPSSVNKSGEYSLWTTATLFILITLIIVLSFFLPTSLESLIHEASLIY